MYSNIPIIELKAMLSTIFKSTNIHSNIIEDLMNLYNLIVEQNCVAYEDKLFRQKEGLAMGCPSSAILSEIYLLYMEYNFYSKIIQNIISWGTTDMSMIF